MSPNRIRIVWKSLFAAACLLVSSLASATAFAESDLLVVQVQNGAEFPIDSVKLVNVTTKASSTDQKSLRPNNSAKSTVELDTSPSAKTTESYELQIESPEFGNEVCAEFDVMSENGQINRIMLTGPKNTWSLSRVKIRHWPESESAPQIATITAKVLGNTDRMRCNFTSIRRADK